MLKKIYYKLPPNLQDYINKAAARIHNNTIDEFINSDVGLNYNLSSYDKKKIVQRIQITLSKINSATSLDVQIELGKKILQLDPNNKNYIVECGCFKGASSVALSIFSKITDRKLIIYDSFQGLPVDEDKISTRYYPHLKVTGKYDAGMYKGAKEEVITNLKNFGEYEACILREGFFKESMKTHKEKIDFLFLDVDLLESTKDCIVNLWNFVQDEKYVFSDDACDMDVVSIWFNNEWWQKNLNCDAPGYVGSGCGISLGGKYSSLGYSIKKPNLESFNKASFLK